MLCDRLKCLPSQLDDEDTNKLNWFIHIMQKEAEHHNKLMKKAQTQKKNKFR